MSPNTAMLTGREALLGTLSDSGMEAMELALGEVPARSVDLFGRMQAGNPAVVVVTLPDTASLDVMALRWVYPGGITPLVLCPSSARECAELAQIAANAARLLNVPVFLLLEDSVAEDTWQPDELETPEISFEDPAPVDALLEEPDVAEMQSLEARLSRRPRGFQALRVEATPDNARPEWAVLAYGATTHAAAAAVQQARDAGQRVVLARVRMLWPVPDEELLKAVMGIKHVVVAERNLGQYALEVRRVLPELPVIPAGQPKAPVPHELILQRLQRSPRCC